MGRVVYGVGRGGVRREEGGVRGGRVVYGVWRGGVRGGEGWCMGWGGVV